ncbi:hypothetical protein ACVGOW_19740 [Pseudonocardia saturnea]
MLADLADGSGNAHDATAARWDAVDAANRSVTLRRVVRLPAVPRAGEVIYVDPYSDELRVQSVTWTVDPDDDEPTVSLKLSDIDFDVIGNDDDALDAFLASGWTAED